MEEISPGAPQSLGGSPFSVLYGIGDKLFLDDSPGLKGLDVD
jgi:hypothetical protein